MLEGLQKRHDEKRRFVLISFILPLFDGNVATSYVKNITPQLCSAVLVIVKIIDRAEVYPYRAREKPDHGGTQILCSIFGFLPD